MSYSVLRSKKSVIILLLVVFSFLGVNLFASLESISDVKLNPISISVAPDASLPAEVKSLEQDTLQGLINRDTTKGYSTYSTSSVFLDFTENIQISAIKIYSKSDYDLQVYSYNGVSY